MIIDSKLIKQNSNILDVIGRYTELKKKGSEHVGLCPFHEDKHSSLNVNEGKQVFLCGPCGISGDSFHFLKLMGRTYHEAAEEISGQKIDGNAEIKLIQNPKRESKKPDWVIIKPEGYPEKFTHYKYGEPTAVWEYLDIDGEIINFTCRFDPPGEKKQVLPYSYAKDIYEKKEWRWIGIVSNQPLYNLHLLKMYPDATILLVEGEKVADACLPHLNLEKGIPMTWVGGSERVKKIDFSPIYGRKIVLWRDNDIEQKYGPIHPQKGEIKPWYEQSGAAAMLEINEILKPHCQIIKWVDVPSGLPDKWDAADREWKPGELRDFILNRSGEVPPVIIVPTPKKEAPAEIEPSSPEIPPVKKSIQKIQSAVDNSCFRFLGYNNDGTGKLVYSFFAYDAGKVIHLNPTSMTKPNLMQMAPLNYWESLFGNDSKSSKYDIDSAQQFLIGKSHDVGIFEEKSIRGRGAWMDDGKIVIHKGNELVVMPNAASGITDVKRYNLREFVSKYVYEINQSFDLGGSVPLTNQKSNQIIKAFEWIKWERDVNAYLMAGWCVIAPFCGLLPWRPHAWLTGPAQAGKSFVFSEMVKRLLGDISLVVQGKTTEPGIRQELQSDARPVIFDEADVDDQNDKDRLQANLNLARSSSSETGAKINKGGHNGFSKSYEIRSMFLFASIGILLDTQADWSRFTVLGMVKHPGGPDEFDSFKKKWDKLTTPEFIKSFHSRSLELLPVILANAITFSKAIIYALDNKRVGDQTGILLAGAYSLKSKKEISLKDAIEWVKKRDWSEERGLELTRDEYRLLAKIMSQTIRTDADARTVDRTIGELISLAASLESEMHIAPQLAANHLRRIGIIVKDKMVMVSNNSEFIKRVLKGSSWGTGNYNQILERLPGSKKLEPKVYASGSPKSRGISFPIDLISDDIYRIAPEVNAPTIMPAPIENKQQELFSEYQSKPGDELPL